jgi:hypothetical protein
MVQKGMLARRCWCTLSQSHAMSLPHVEVVLHVVVKASCLILAETD